MRNLKTILIILTVFFWTVTLKAQVGIGTIVPDGALDVSSTTDGLLIPRVLLTITTSPLPLTLPTVSELVYNSATVADVTPGYYYWNGTIWVRLAAAATTNWTITGNTGIVDGTNFIGTAALTNVDVAFRRNNLAAGKISATSTSFGLGALTSGAASNSTAFGNNALVANTTGASNVAIGTSALAANTTSGSNTAVGFNSLLVNTAANNTSIGSSSMVANTTGASNVAVGASALAANTTGATNVAIGNSTLAANITGIQNTGVGNNALLLNTGSASTAIGFEALRANTSGNNGTALGFQALLRNTSASNNTAVGFQSMVNNTTGNENTAIGFQASSIGATGTKNTAVGHIALNNNTGSENTAIGHSSMTGLNNVASRFNTALGFQSMFASTGNVSNVVAIGANALFQNTASNSIGVGFQALQGQVGNATNNTGVGYRVLNNNNAGDNNTAVGFEAGFNALGNGNTIIGCLAGQNASNATGASTFVGFQAGQNSTGANNTAIGNNALVATGASGNNVAVGNNSLNANTSTNNTAVGFSALRTNNNTGNVAIGNQAGELETGSNTLYITNSATTPTTSLIYGDFSGTRILRTNSTFQIGDPTGTGYVFPIARGTVNQILQTNGSGVMTWVSPSSLSITETDPQVSSATNNTIPKWNGTTLVDGIVTDSGTTVSIAGTTSTTNFQMTAGATANHILQSNATGNATWVNPTVKPYVTTGVAVGVYTVLLTEYTVRVFNGVSEVRLPNATGNTGKVFIIIGSNAITSKIFSTAGGIIYDDVSNAFISTLNPNERYMVQSDGIDWIVIGR